MSVPPSQGLVPRNILTQLSRERGGAIESSFMGRADVEWVVRRQLLYNPEVQLGPRPRLGGAILAGPPVPELCSRVRCTGRDMRGVGAPMKVISKVNSTFDVLQPCKAAPSRGQKLARFPIDLGI